MSLLFVLSCLIQVLCIVHVRYFSLCHLVFASILRLSHMHSAMILVLNLFRGFCSAFHFSMLAEIKFRTSCLASGFSLQQCWMSVGTLCLWSASEDQNGLSNAFHFAPHLSGEMFAFLTRGETVVTVVSTCQQLLSPKKSVKLFNSCHGVWLTSGKSNAY